MIFNIIFQILNYMKIFFSLAKHAAKFENVKGIAVTPPCYFKPKDEEMVA